MSETKNLAIKMDKITKTFGKVVANKDVNLELKEGEILALLGENGCGKSTFIKTIMGEVPKLGGKFCFGQKIEIGYFDQNVESLDGEKTVLDIVNNLDLNKYIILSKHDNIFLNLCGHMGSSEIIYRTDKGKNGNEKHNSWFRNVQNADAFKQ